MILINKLKTISGLTHSQYYRLTVELDDREISYTAKPNRKDGKKIDIICKSEDLTEVITLLAKVKTMNKDA